MTSTQIREQFLHFFKNEKHQILPSSSLIPQNDPSLLFVNAGMNQFKNIFLGQEKSKHSEVITIQKCLRAGGKHNDIENVGKTAWHHTFFEMLGNFSFGSYFKKRAIELAWKFLTEQLQFSEDHLWISVFEEDEESYEIWRNHIHIPTDRILRMGKESNFWQMGDVGPCGPCSEIHYYDGPLKEFHPDKLVEIWNLVFMEFFDQESKERSPLPQPCVDTGMGLERVTSLIQKAKSNYHTDLFKDLIQTLEKHSSHKYFFSEHKMTEEQIAYRVIADHSRAVSFLISDGVIPGSEGANYVLRRIMRRAFYYNQKLNARVNLLEKGAEKVMEMMSPVYPQLLKDKSIILSLIQEESVRFSKSLEMGRKRLIDRMKSLPEPNIDFETAWDLYSTYGFPIDLTRLIAIENNYKMLDEDQFDKEKSQLEKSQKNLHSSKKNLLEDLIKTLKPHHKKQPTLFTGYEKNQDKASLLFLFENHSPYSEVKKLNANEEGWILLDQTCFYPEGGGPIGDQGSIQTETGRAQVLDTQKRIDLIFHKVKVVEGVLNPNSSCELVVTAQFRSLVRTSHSATHLLNSSLRKILGDTVRQAGSLVEPGYLRFDFTQAQALTEKQLEMIEEDVRSKIKNKESVSSHTLPYQQALQEGALSLQGENYTKEVRVIQIGQDSSKELCGGIHVGNTSEIEDFKIISETGVQSGVRRILALTSLVSKQWEEDLKNQTLELANHLKISKKSLDQKENPFLKWEADINQETENLRNQIVNLKSSNSSGLKKEQTISSQVKNSRRHPYIQFNLALRNHLNLPTPKQVEPLNPFLDWVSKKQTQFNQMEIQFKNMTELSRKKDQLLKQASDFKMQDIQGKLLIVQLPLQDKKLLADTADQLKSHFSDGIVIAIGEFTNFYPVVVTVTKNLQKYISAGDILKNKISPLLQGKGGGQKHFAQGSLSDLSQLSELNKLLLQDFKS